MRVAITNLNFERQKINSKKPDDPESTPHPLFEKKDMSFESATASARKKKFW